MKGKPRINVFADPEEEQGSLGEMVEDLYGGAGGEDLYGGRQVVRPTDINTILADVTQARRAVPAEVRRLIGWNGAADDVSRVLEAWRNMACAQTDTDIAVGDVLRAGSDSIDPEGTQPLFREYVALLRLAESIRSEGLLHPIRIVRHKGKWLIESGERRWLAFWLLYVHLGGDWERIPAIASDTQGRIWRQAMENLAREDLNAISKARQLALLIMAARQEAGARYEAWETMVEPDGCDRAWYAQVYDGMVHRVPYGTGDQILSTLGINRSEMARCRSLLRLTDDEAVNDELWQQGDAENWRQGFLLQVATLSLESLRAVVLKPGGWTPADMRRDLLRETARLQQGSLSQDPPRVTGAASPRSAELRSTWKVTETPASRPQTTERPSGMGYPDASVSPSEMVEGAAESAARPDAAPDASVYAALVNAGSMLDSITGQLQQLRESPDNAATEFLAAELQALASELQRIAALVGRAGEGDS